MATIIEFEGKRPQVAAGVFLAGNATLIGDVRIEEGVSIWFGAVLRGDFGSIVVGAGSSVQDNVVVHATEEFPTLIGTDVAIGHAAALEGCVIEHGALIGMGSVVLERSRIGEGSVVAAGCVVTEGFEVPPRSLVAGVPGVVKKELETGLSLGERAASEYHRMRDLYLRASSP